MNKFFNFHNLLKYVSDHISTFVVLFAFAFTGCNKATTNSQSTSGNSTINDATGKAKMLCNQVSASSYKLTLRVYDADGPISHAYTYMKVGQVPASFDSDGEFMMFYRWKATPGVSLDQSGLSFRLIDQKNKIYISDWMTRLSDSDVRALRSKVGATSNSAFFSKVLILVNLNDVAKSYHAIRMVNYRKGDNASLAAVDLLIPEMYMYPQDFANDNGTTRPSIIQNLHPFQGKNYTDAMMRSTAQQFCDDLTIVR
ncbi:MAG: hypothetical protein V4736_04870 [Bdellovibrionota bacterium]